MISLPDTARASKSEPGRVAPDLLDKEVIRRYIRRRTPQYKHCYEQPLLLDPTLQGTVTVQFTIGPDGTVLALYATADTVAMEKVADCVGERVRGVQFPKPTPSGLVNVRFPFVFTPKP